MDGVLADDSKSYRQAVIDTAETYGVSLTFKDVSEADAGGNANDVWIVTQRLLAKNGVVEDLEDVTERFERIYQGTGRKPGLRESERLLIDVDRLRRIAKRFPLGIVTGRPRKDAAYFLEKSGIADLFQTLVCHEDGPLKPDPAPVLRCLENLGVKRAWMIGDTPDDITAARRARVLPIGTLPPGIDPEIIEKAMYKAGAAKVLTDVNQLEGLLP
jgi:HAD superfamily hydrolase (TIGR01548 family)